MMDVNCHNLIRDPYFISLISGCAGAVIGALASILSTYLLIRKTDENKYTNLYSALKGEARINLEAARNGGRNAYFSLYAWNGFLPYLGRLEETNLQLLIRTYTYAQIYNNVPQIDEGLKTLFLQRAAEWFQKLADENPKLK
jgi:hypothetical protein